MLIRVHTTTKHISICFYRNIDARQRIFSPAVGPSSIPVSILKILKGALSEPLQIIFNALFLTGIVTKQFKLARVVPAFKKGSQANLNNYRPISLLFIFNKLLEKMVYNRLSNCLEKRQLIYSKEFGFRSHHSTGHAVLSIIDKVQKAIKDRGGNTYQSSLQRLIVLQKKAIKIGRAHV